MEAPLTFDPSNSVLGLKRDATDEDIKRNYRKAAARFHPDRNLEDPVGATENFKKISRANEVLSDINKRAIYDKDGLDGLDMYEKMASAGFEDQMMYDYFCGTPWRRCLFGTLFFMSGCCYCCCCCAGCCGLCLPKMKKVPTDADGSDPFEMNGTPTSSSTTPIPTIIIVTEPVPAQMPA